MNIKRAILNSLAFLLILAFSSISFFAILKGTEPFMIQQSNFLYRQILDSYDMDVLEHQYNDSIKQNKASHDKIIHINEYNRKDISIPLTEIQL